MKRFAAGKSATRTLTAKGLHGGQGLRVQGAVLRGSEDVCRSGESLWPEMFDWVKGTGMDVSDIQAAVWMASCLCLCLSQSECGFVAPNPRPQDEKPTKFHKGPPETGPCRTWIRSIFGLGFAWLQVLGP